jgi:hypothetical protein
LFSSGAGDAGGCDHIAVIAFFGEISLQGIAYIRCLITQFEYPGGKALAESVKLARQAL